VCQFHGSNVIHCLGDIVAAREFGALLSHPGLQIGDQRRAELLSNSPAPFRALSVDRPLDLKQRVNPADRFQRQRRDHRRLLALRLATGVLGQIRHHEERTPGMNPSRQLPGSDQARGHPRKACHSLHRRQRGGSRCSWPSAPGDACRPGHASNKTPPPAVPARQTACRPSRKPRSGKCRSFG
jgi:hypothetical protein